MKTGRIMRQIARGWRETPVMNVGIPPDDENPFVIWGHLFTSIEAVPKARAQGRDFWFVDNGWFEPARGHNRGYYRLTFKGFDPVQLPNPDMKRNPIRMLPWQKKAAKGHIVLAQPGAGFGAPFGFDLKRWTNETIDKLCQHTDRNILIREKGAPRSLYSDMDGAHALVTHSSAVGVDAVVHGIPVFVHPGSAAAPMGCDDLSMIESPVFPEWRDEWWASLMCQQFTNPEMASGLAFEYCSLVRDVHRARDQQS